MLPNSQGSPISIHEGPKIQPNLLAHCMYVHIRSRTFYVINMYLLAGYTNRMQSLYTNNNSYQEIPAKKCP